MMDRRERDALDRYITGNYGEDQFRGSMVNEEEITRRVDGLFNPPDDHDNFRAWQAANAVLGPMTDTGAIVALGNMLEGFSKAGYHILGGPRAEILIMRGHDTIAQASWNRELNLWAISDLRHELRDPYKREYLDDES